MFAIEKDEAKRRIAALAEHFSRDIADFRSATYNETQTRHQFIDPLFEALGWDVQNRNRYAEAYKDVIHEDAIKVQGGTKAPDYCFRIGGRRIFFVEAKKPAMNIQMDASLAYQLRRYGWSSRLNVSILTDFEEFAVYDCRIKPLAGDSVAVARIRYLRYDTYLDNFNELWDLFARDSVLKGSLDRFAEDTRAKRGTAPVDQEFLKEIERWRDLLARTIALRNPALDVRGLNIAVQRTIDRIIFLRICEDRGIEEYGALMGLCNGPGVYERLRQRFDLAEQRYNSGLFHFEREKGIEEAPDTLTPSLVIDDKPLADILKKLYYPDSPYEFSMIGADILGQVYEQFLGKVIRLTAGHQAKVEEKPEVRKAGGVFYTPTYIVDYIVKNTVGTLCADKRPAEVKKLKILDPACGSGSFLLGAYQYLIDYCRDWYVQDGPEKHGKRVYQAAGGQWLLTTAEKRELLTSCIHGVDIDAQAVEVTKLNLLLKCLEGESGESIAQHNLFYKERALPNLGANVKCGNSLIGSDYFDDYQDALFDDETVRRVNPFDWDGPHGFPAIMKAGGFDAVIGNPPYVRQEMLSDLKPYFKKRYRTFHGVADLYVYFIESGLRLIGANGYYSIIVSNKWMRANYGGPLREFLSRKEIEEIIDFGDLPVFQGATTYPCIVRVRNHPPREEFSALNVRSLSFSDLRDVVRESAITVTTASLQASGWTLVDQSAARLLNKLRRSGIPLKEYVNGEIYYGIKTGLNKAFVIDSSKREELIVQDPSSEVLIKPFLVGKEIKRYQQPVAHQYLILIPKGFSNSHSLDPRKAWQWFQSTFPAIAGHLVPFKDAAQKRQDKGDHWWELRACIYYEKFEAAKFIYPDISQVFNFTLDRNKFYLANTAYFFNCDDVTLLGILNSKLLTFYYSNISSMFQGGYYRYFTQYVERLPILCTGNYRLLTPLINLYIQLSDNGGIEVSGQLRLKLNALDRQINNIVNQIYGLTEEEIRIVEESLNEHT